MLINYRTHRKPPQDPPQQNLYSDISKDHLSIGKEISKVCHDRRVVLKWEMMQEFSAGETWLSVKIVESQDLKWNYWKMDRFGFIWNNYVPDNVPSMRIEEPRYIPLPTSYSIANSQRRC